MNKVIVRNKKNIKSFADVCGAIKVLSTGADNQMGSLAIATITAPTVPHYHKVINEFYFVLRGHGKLIVGGRMFPLASGALAIIPPNLAHYTIPEKRMEVAAFASPPWHEDDQFVLQINETAADYSAAYERALLVDEILARAGLAINENADSRDRAEIREERMRYARQNELWRLSLADMRELLRIK